MQMMIEIDAINLFYIYQLIVVDMLTSEDILALMSKIMLKEVTYVTNKATPKIKKIRGF